MAKQPRSVFINCPFDGTYRPLFYAIIFTVTRCGFKPRSALEIVDGGGTRIAKIEKLIELSPLGIHDVSRTELDAINNLPRFNMPLELGLFLGAKRFGSGSQKRKRCLVLDRDQYRYHMFMSDIAGQDIEAHNDDVDIIISKVRSFLNSTVHGAPLPSGAIIKASYDAFNAALPTICERLEVDPANLDYRDFAWIVADFVSV